MEVKFGNVQVSLVGFITTETAQQPLTMEWIANPNSLYTIMLYDMDAPYPAPNNNKSPYLNLLVTNVKGMDILSGSSLIPYEAPYPPPNSLPHTYNADVYYQPQHITPVQHRVRNNFNLMEFTQRHNLSPVVRTSFKVGQLVSTTGTPVPSVESISSPRKAETTNFFLPGSDLPEKKRKWCRCVLKVANKQRGACNVERSWFESRDGTVCYNPYSVCSSSVGTSSRECGKHYDFESFSDDHLITYAQLHQKDKDGIIIEIPDPYNRAQMLANIKRWKEMKGK